MCALKPAKKFEKHKKSKSNLINALEKVKCDICESFYQPIDKKAWVYYEIDKVWCLYFYFQWI